MDHLNLTSNQLMQSNAALISSELFDANCKLLQVKQTIIIDQIVVLVSAERLSIEQIDKFLMFPWK